MKELVVVIPVYNEEEVIGKVVADWMNVLGSLKVSFTLALYNDGSVDDTEQVLKVLKQNNENIQVYSHKNIGHGPTILKGYLAYDEAEWVFQVDADNEISAAHFKKLWEIRNQYDFIAGYRDSNSRNGIRRIITQLTRAIVTVFFGAGVKDVNVPYRLLRMEKFTTKIKTINKNTFAPNIIISGIAVKNKLKIKNIPVANQQRKTGTVSIQKWSLIKACFTSFSQTISYALANK